MADSKHNWVVSYPDADGNIHINMGNSGLHRIALVDNTFDRAPEHARLIVSAVNQREELLRVLNACLDALRSYQFGNAATDLAKECADAAQVALAEARKAEEGA